MRRLLVVALLGVALALPARADAVQLPRHHCGWVAKFVEVRARGVGCSTAMKVGRRDWKGHRHPLGFICREVKVRAGAGYYDRCTKGRGIVAVIPE